MIKNMKILLVLLLAVVLVLPVNNFAKGKEGNNRLKKVLGVPNTTKLNINNISTYFRSNGDSDLDNNGNSGFVFPKGSGKTAFFESGFLWGAKVNGTDLRVGGSAYSSGLQSGRILSPGVAEDPGLDKNRIYRVRPDYKTASLANEATDEGISEADVYAQYETDWNEWPATEGAPYEDVDGNGSYNPNVDIPGVPGASQTIWFVANDLDPSLTALLYGSLPIGIEMQATIWAYAQAGPLGNMLFRKYTIVNKSTDVLNDVYVTMWSDVDLGNATDDFAGCDTTLSLGYVYNATATDATYGETPPPASGFDFFQGPIVDSPGDTAIYKNQKVADKKNLPMTAFYYFARGDLSVVDPTTESYEGTVQFYNFMQGKIGKTGEYFTTPAELGAHPTPYAVSGDPVTGEGWIDGMLIQPDDRRIGVASGPFTMNPGDEQEIVVAQIAALGADRLNSVTLLKAYDAVAQDAYNNFFQIPKGADQPIVTASSLDQEIILTWGDDAAASKTEGYDERGYKFQGYNVYQLPTASASKADGRLIATYDIIDGNETLYDYVFDSRTGKDEYVATQYGKDSGIRRSIKINQDYLNGGRALRNGSRYYFAVTTYSFNEDPLAVPQVLENPLQIITVVPYDENPGIRYTSTYGETLTTVTHTTSGAKSDGSVVVIVQDPTKVTGHEYKVTFETNAGETSWKLTDVTNGEVKLEGQLNQTGDDNYFIVDGLLVKVIGPPNSFKDFLVLSNAAGPLDPPEYGAFAFNDSGFPHPTTDDRPTENQQVGDGEWGIHTGNVDDESYDYNFFITRVTQGGARWPRLIPNDFEIRFTGNGKAFIYPGSDYGGAGHLKDVTFELWNIGNASDPNDDVRYFPYILDSDENGEFGLTNFTHPLSGGANDPETDWIYWVIPADHSPGQSGYDAIVNKITTVGDENHEYMDASIMVGDALRRIVLVNWNGGSVDNYPNYDQALPEVGTVFRIVTNKTNSASDEFRFTAPTNTNSTELAKEDIKRVNVFPNPYYGANPEELNKYQRFVTFNHLPREATIRIFNLAGEMVRTIRKNNDSQFERWELTNDRGLPVGSGLFLAYIDMPGLGTKVLKFTIIQEQQILDRF
ncbi:MAG: hypothetical protein AB1521_01280 [Bacteroidota bacterium]